jgi:hypothetical protein
MKSVLYNTNDHHSFNKLVNMLNGLDEFHQGKVVTYRIDIIRNRPVRSVDQNRYYWALLTMIAAQSGYTKEKLHHWYGLEFLAEDFNGKMIPRSTSELNTEEMSNYIKKVKTHAEEFYSVNIPRPEDKEYINWERMANNFYDDMFRSIE